MLEPATPESLSPESTTTQVAPFTPRRRSRISAVALLMLAFGAGTAMSWLLFGEPLRARNQVWNLVPLALQTAKGSSAGLLPRRVQHPMRRAMGQRAARQPSRGARPSRRPRRRAWRLVSRDDPPPYGSPARRRQGWRSAARNLWRRGGCRRRV
jgi:hypothetical protein